MASNAATKSFQVNLPKGANRRVLYAAITGAVLCVAVGLLLHFFTLGQGFARLSYDTLLIARGDIRADEAVIVYLDEVSHKRMGQAQNAPWDRALHAKLIDRLTKAGARAIVFDIVFSDPDPQRPEADIALADAIKRSGGVILAADNVPIGIRKKQMTRPFDLLMDATMNIGSVEFVPDRDLVIRRHTPRGDNPLPSLSWVTVEFLELPVTKAEGGELTPRWMNYYGQPGLIHGRSYFEALDESAVPDAFFKDKVVFVGARIFTKFAGERKDEYPSPFTLRTGGTQFMPGVEIQATAFLNLLREDWLRRFSWGLEAFVLVVMGIGVGVGLIFVRPVWATAIALAGMILVAVAAYGLFRLKLIWFPWVLVTVQIGVALGWSVLFNSIQLYVKQRLFEHTLSLYLSPKLVRKFARSPTLLKPGAEKQEVTLLFTDIEGFTTVSEKMDGDELAAVMNEYFENAVSLCVHKTDGTVVKYLGDSIFAIWNAPELQSDQHVRACEAALRFVEQNRKPVRERLLPTRIGLHTGVANVGNFGSLERVDYTAIGENVNLASRLEGLNKHLGTRCLISGATRAGIGDRFVTRLLGHFQLKGFEALVEVHELIDWKEQAEATRPWREAFAQAHNNYEQRELMFAEIGFRRVLELKPDDGPSKFYLNRIAELSKEELPDNWSTHTIIREK